MRWRSVPLVGIHFMQHKYFDVSLIVVIEDKFHFIYKAIEYRLSNPPQYPKIMYTHLFKRSYRSFKGVVLNWQVIPGAILRYEMVL